MTERRQNYDVAAFVWPSYTGDEPRTRMFWPEGIGEWQTVHTAEAKYPGHQWPRRPRWGYCNEADPYVMEMQINAAADYGVNVFIYDWYWYDGRPFLENCLNDGYLKARNNDRVKFYIMWANHDVKHLWDKRIAHVGGNIIWRAGVDRKEFAVVAHRIIDKYFSQPSYYRIDDKPVFMIYDLKCMVEGLGGIQATADAFAWWQEQAVAAGLKGIHFQLCGRRKILDVTGVDGNADATPNDVVKQIGFESQSHYQMVHFTNVDRDYAEIIPDMVKAWQETDAAYDMPYFPHVSVGWDNNPRFQMRHGQVVQNNTPENIRKAFEMARDYVDAHPEQPPLVTVNSWNEWTETSYLQPDDLYGYGYLEAVKAVFKGE